MWKFKCMVNFNIFLKIGSLMSNTFDFLKFREMLELITVAKYVASCNSDPN